MQENIKALLWSVHDIFEHQFLKCDMPLKIMFMSFRLKWRKPMFGVFDQVMLKPVCSATETSLNAEILNESSLDIIPSREQITMVLIRLQAGLHFCCSHATVRVSHVMAHIKYYLIVSREDFLSQDKTQSLNTTRFKNSPLCLCLYIHKMIYSGL